MKVYVSVKQMKEAREELGRPAEFNEALVSTGIDAFFALLDGQSVEIDGKLLRLVELGPPSQTSLFGIIRRLMVSENPGDVQEAINLMCDLAGVDRPEGNILDGWEASDWSRVDWA